MSAQLQTPSLQSAPGGHQQQQQQPPQQQGAGPAPSPSGAGPALPSTVRPASNPHHAPQLVPYMPMPPTSMPPQGPQSQIICNGCRTLLVYPQGASNVRCALCNSITAVPPSGTDMAQLVCGGCRTLLMYMRGATSVQCSCCNTVNIAMHANQIAHINCGGCGMTLMYAYGAQSVKCAVCNSITHVTAPVPPRMPMHGQTMAVMPQQQQQQQQQQPAPPQQTLRPQQQTVVVENPPTVGDDGKMVRTMAVGITSDKPGEKPVGAP
eukprot:jgi/Chlat1/2104/Chrsp17S02697